ncbi:glycosyl hydrolase family 28-related protein [Paenibacillus enshidis]|uniref:Glycosyl hydrolase family 28-related protein n=1 Tax=Paenibacillus enshidis TaxID=1458439 RepID=A0ABV5AUN7_9BACL
MMNSVLINVTDLGAVGDGVTDDTAAINNAIDEAYKQGGGTVFIPRTSSAYKAVKIGLRNKVSIISDGAKLIPVTSSEPSFMYVAEDGFIQNVQYRGFSIEANDANTSQNGMDFTAKIETSGGYSGGLWYSELRDIRIKNFSGLGLKLYCDDLNDPYPNNDTANQFLRFINVRIFRNSATAKCLEITGQLGQTVFETCQFDGNSRTLGGVNVDLVSLLTTNDQLSGPVKFDNCTFQAAQKAIKTYYVNNLVLDSCWFENLDQVVDLTSSSNATIDNCHFTNVGAAKEGTGYGVSVGTSCTVGGAGNFIVGNIDNFVVGYSTQVNRGINISATWGSDASIPLKDTTPDVSGAAIVSNTLKAFKHKIMFVHITTSPTISNIQSHHLEGETLVLRCWAGGDNSKILTVNGAGNIVMPNGVAKITLKQNDTITFIKTDSIGLPSQYVVIGHTGDEIG